MLFFSIFVNVHFFSEKFSSIKKCHPLFLQHRHHHKTTTTILYHSVANVPRLWVPYYTFLGICQSIDVLEIFSLSTVVILRDIETTHCRGKEFEKFVFFSGMYRSRQLDLWLDNPEFSCHTCVQRETGSGLVGHQILWKDNLFF